jgi:SAM-dependent methyltransferase
MAETDRRFAGSIPALYDRYLGPLIFEPYAADIAGRVAADAPLAVLETAAGTGVVTQALARALPAAAITATDLNLPMLDFAAAKPGLEYIAWRRADAQALPLPDASFDAVVCQFGVMFFPDRIAAYREARRVLKADGRFLFNVWDRIEENDFATLVTGALARLFPDEPPLFLARTPHGYHDAAVIEGELRAAGFGRVAAETVTKRSRAPSPHDPAIGFCQGTPLRTEIEARAPDRLAEATAAAAAAIAGRFGAGAVDGRIQALVVVAEGRR